MLILANAMTGVWLTAAAAGFGVVSAVSPSTGPHAVDARPDRRLADVPASLLGLADEDLLRLIESDPAALGSLSIGTPGASILVNGVALPPSPRWTVASNADTWGTSETMAAIETVVDTVHQLFPETPPIVIGDISDEDGGRLKRHQSHQGGRDVDFGFYYLSGKGGWYTPGASGNLDLPRNWALVRALLVRTDVETILLDTRIQRLLYQYALSISEDKAWLDRVFQFSKGSRDALIVHLPNHRTHYHVRFYNPVAQELGRRAHPLLVQAKILPQPVYTVRHVVQPGQTLGHLAMRYGTSVAAIQRANGLTSTLLRAGRAYYIPVRSAASASPQPIVVPMRMLPPSTPEAMVSVAWPTIEELYGSRLNALVSELAARLALVAMGI